MHWGLGAVAHACNPNYSGGEGRRIMLWDQPVKNHSEKQSKRIRDVPKMVQCLPCKHKALNSITIKHTHTHKALGAKAKAEEKEPRASIAGNGGTGC
jgi:hypothetical protein